MEISNIWGTAKTQIGDAIDKNARDTSDLATNIATLYRKIEEVKDLIPCAELTVNTWNNTTVICSNGDVSLTYKTGANERKAVFKLPWTGDEWTVTAKFVVPLTCTSLAGETLTKVTTVSIPSIEKYSCDATFKSSDDWSDCSWDEVIVAAQTNNIDWDPAKSYYTKEVEAEKYNRFEIFFIASNHDTYADTREPARMTFAFNTPIDMAMNSTDTNAGGWRDSEGRETILSQCAGYLPEELQRAIRPMLKKTSLGGSNTSIVETSDKFALFSEVELFGSAAFSETGEGNPYGFGEKLPCSVESLCYGAPTSGRYYWTRSPITKPSDSFSSSETGFLSIRNGKVSHAYSEASLQHYALVHFCI